MARLVRGEVCLEFVRSACSVDRQDWESKIRRRCYPRITLEGEILRRSSLIEHIGELVGAQLRLEEFADGWPAKGTVRAQSIQIPVSLFVGPIGLGYRESRVDIERRFQNPAQDRPIFVESGRHPLLLGLWEGDSRVGRVNPVFALAEAERREGYQTRWSVFVALETLRKASSNGWASQRTDAGEEILCFRPELFALAVGRRVGEIDVDDSAIESALRDVVFPAHGAAGRDESVALERMRRVSARIVRNGRFSRQVMEAYARRCGMCGVALPILEGAHIYPASAPGASDHPTNGIALCANHHAAFDRDLIAIDPDTLRIRFSPDALAIAHRDAATGEFVASTFDRLTGFDPQLAPDANCIRRRYDFYSDKYLWLLDSEY